MPKSKKRSQQRRPQRHSRLADHQRQGKLLRPPMLAAIGDKAHAVSWAKEHLPDFLWNCWHLAAGAPADLVQLGKWLDMVEEIIGADRDGYPERWLLTGRLTSFEAMPVPARERLLDRLRADEMYDVLIPAEFAHALGMYPLAPGRWLIQPWLDAGMTVDPEVARRGLARVVAASLDGRDPVATRAKAVVFRQFVVAGRLVLPRELVSEMQDEMMRYPMRTTAEETAKIESFIRASVGAIEELTALDGESDRVQATWARTFWRANWRLFPCERHRAALVGPQLSDDDRAAAKSAVQEVIAEVRALHERFVQLADTTDPDLYDPDRYEVLTGLVARVLRHLSVYIGYPPLWTMEHGAPLLRAVVEARIIVRYLVHAEPETDLFRRFKAYGMGRLKLLKLHFEEYLTAEENPHEDMIAYVDYLEALVNQDTMEEFQDIDLGGNFAGKDMRSMAADVELEREYRLLFAPASSNVHGEWSVIDEYALERCRNPLHMGHRIVRHDVSGPIGSTAVETVVEFATLLVDEYEEATRPERAFAAETPGTSDP